MPFKLNQPAVDAARTLILQGGTEDAIWFPLDDYEIRSIIGDSEDWSAYGRLFLGVQDGAIGRDAYAYPVMRPFAGPSPKVILEALRNVRVQAAKQGEMDIFGAADELLALAAGARFTAAEEAGRWVEIFGAGTWTDSNGTTRTFSAGDLEAIVEAFNATKDVLRVPLRLGGHDFTLAPSVGWAGKLKAVGGKLLALFTDVPAIVEAAFDKGLYRSVSAGLWFDWQHGGKTWPMVLNHVAVLGAALPAVKGLADLGAYLAQGGAEVHLFTMRGEDGMTELEQAREDLKKANARVKELEDANAGLAAKVSGFSQAAGKAEVERLVDAAISGGRLLPKNRESTVNVGLGILQAGQFSTGEDNKAFGAFRDMLEKSGKVLEFSEKAPTGTAPESGDPESDAEAEAGRKAVRALNEGK